MIYSMTGYGRYEIEELDRKITVEISAINHRYLDLNIRMPRMLAHLEESIRGLIKERVSRGKLEVSIFYHSTAQEDIEVSFNENLASVYIEELRLLGEQLGVEDNLKLSDLMQINDLVTIQKKAGDIDIIASTIEKAVMQALDELIDMRLKEGTALKEDILVKNENLGSLIEAIERRSPSVIIEYRQRLESRLSQLLEQVPVDEGRIATEVALFADKCAVDEELTRLRSHRIQLQDILIEGGTVGRKLDFLMQEMNREANTIGSKANDCEITKHVVTLKTEIEKIREQVQNIE